MLLGQSCPTQGWGKAGSWLGSPGEMEGPRPFSSEPVPRLVLRAPRSCNCTGHGHREMAGGCLVLTSRAEQPASQWLRMQILSKALPRTTTLSELVKVSNTWAERG